jgi:hypothetical protein
VPPGVDEAAYVKAGFLSAVAKGDVSSPRNHNAATRAHTRLLIHASLVRSPRSHLLTLFVPLPITLRFRFRFFRSSSSAITNLSQNAQPSLTRSTIPSARGKAPLYPLTYPFTYPLTCDYIHATSIRCQSTAANQPLPSMRLDRSINRIDRSADPWPSDA